MITIPAYRKKYGITGEDAAIKLAIVHHHLKPGGVTRVIESTIQAARSHAPELKCAVITGRRRPPSIKNRMPRSNSTQLYK